MGDSTSLVWDYMEGPVYNYLEENMPSNTQAKQALIKIINEFYDLWYFDHTPNVNLFMRQVSLRLIIPIVEQKRNNTENLLSIIEESEININSVMAQFDFWAVQLNNLKRHGEKYKVIGDFDDESLDRSDKARRLMEILKDSKDSIVSTNLARRKLNKRKIQDPLPPEYDTTTTLTKDIEASNTSFQNLILYVLDLLRQQRLRKFGDYCYIEMFTDLRKPMYAWKEYMTIKDFIYKNVTKERDYTQWKNLTNPRDNDRHIVENIKEAEHPEFASVQLNRSLFAFGNDEDGGLYRLEDDSYWPYGEQHRWPAYGKELEAKRRLWDPDYEAMPPKRTDVAIRYFEQGFLPAWNDGDDNPDDDPMDILKTPEVDKILDDQRLTKETKRWVYILLGRLLYETGRFDNWQILLFFKGVAGSGKSTLAKLMRRVFPPSLVATLSSNVEPKFGLAPLYDKYLIICSEVKKDFGMNQGDLQSAVSGEEVSVAIKHKEAITVLWKVPFLFAGNELAAWKDAAGSMKRRLVVVEFNEPVVPNPRLFDGMIERFPAFLRKINLCYLIYASKHCDTDVWAPGVMPEQLHSFAKNMKENVDLFAGFLSSPEFFMDLHDPGNCYMPLAEVKDMYFNWRREHGYEKEAWKPEVYNTALREKGLYVNDKRTTLNYMGREITGQFVYGIRPAD